HSAWDRFLSAYLSADSAGVHRVDYAAVSLADRELVVSYIDSLEAVDPATLDRPEQLAFWINLYNAQTVALILENYPVDSIRDISSGLFSLGPWDQEAVTISGRTLSLNDIEHGIVRPVYQDARIHYALNCAAVSCPNLATKAFSGKRLDADLTSAEKAYVNDPRGVRLDGEKLVLSSIYNWFRDDFGQTEADIIVRLRKHATGRTADALNGRSEVDEFEYDWALNRR
ncbi:MAG: DUF547 domain-containing protein, partial [Pseudomonadota bacterium]